MSENSNTPDIAGDVSSVAQTTEPEAPVAQAPQPADTPQIKDESTIGTGTSMALGCIAGTVLLIIFGLLFLALSTLV